MEKYRVDLTDPPQETELACISCQGKAGTSEMQYCFGCRRERPVSAFHDDELLESKQDRERCLRCVAKDNKDIRLDETRTCDRCNKNKPWKEYAPLLLKYTRLRPHTRRSMGAGRTVCEECQFPKCAGKSCSQGNPTAIRPWIMN